ncbi:MAG: hypothetical protein RBR42_07210 [Desulfomicrobium sp.]|nr:hypothetical protein [Desulfomicrobium sp.]
MRKHFYTTKEAAFYLGYDVQQIRYILTRDGNFHGIKPTKGARGVLLWPAHEVHNLREQYALWSARIEQQRKKQGGKK